MLLWALTTWLLANPAICIASQGRTLHQTTSTFWDKERRVTNETNPYSTTIVGHSTKTVTAAAFGGCRGALCPIATQLSAFRLCFASQDATVTLSTTLGRRAIYTDSELYIFSVDGDAPPLRDEVDPNLWDPPYSEFWASPTVLEQHFDDNSGAICSTDADVTVNVCSNATAACTPTPAGIQCPPGSSPRLLSKVEFQLTHGYGRPYKCMYAVIGAKDAPAGAETLDFGLDISTAPPRLLPGASPANPRIGPFNLRDLGIGAVPPATSAEPLVEPAWLSLTQAVAIGCDSESCLSDADFGEEANAPMFVYTNLCLEQSADAEQTALVRTRYGGSGPSDTTLFVYNEARTVSEWNDAGARVCSDGSQPSKDNCGADRVCRDEHDQCAGEDVKLWSLSEVEVPVSQGQGPTCFNAGVGMRRDAGDVINIGVDVLLVGPDGIPQAALNVTTEYLANGTIATTTTATDANGTATTTVKLVDPADIAPVAALEAPAAAPDAVQGSSDSAAVVAATAAVPGVPLPPAPPPASPGTPAYTFVSAVDQITGASRAAGSMRRRTLLQQEEEPKATALRGAGSLRVGVAGGDPVLMPLQPGSKDWPRAGPASAGSLGVPVVPVGGAAAAAVDPVWLELRTPSAAGCSGCVAAGIPDTSGVFVYEDICFERLAAGEITAAVRTVHGALGPRHVRLLLLGEDGKPVEDTQQKLRRRCSDGERPSKLNCQGTCAVLDDMCTGRERVVTAAEVSATVASGAGLACFGVAVVVADAADSEPALVGLDLASRVGPGVRQR